MREHINLVPAEILLEREIASKKTFMFSVLIAVVILIGGISGIKFLRINSIKRDLRTATVKREALKTDLAVLTEEASIISNRLKVYKENEKKLQAANTLLNDRIIWSDIVREISLIVPSGVYLTMVESEEKKEGLEKSLRLAGFSDSQAWITNFILSLERSYYFSDVSLVYAQRDSDRSDGQVGMKSNIKFEIKGVLKRR